MRPRLCGLRMSFKELPENSCPCGSANKLDRARLRIRQGARFRDRRRPIRAEAEYWVEKLAVGNSTGACRRQGVKGKGCDQPRQVHKLPSMCLQPPPDIIRHFTSEYSGKPRIIVAEKSRTIRHDTNEEREAMMTMRVTCSWLE